MNSAESIPRVLVCESDDQVREEILSTIHSMSGVASVDGVSSLTEFQSLVNSERCDLLIINYELSREVLFEIIHGAKLSDTSSSVIVISAQIDKRIVADLYNAGCQRCIFKEEDWILELGRATRHLLRIRKLETENRSLVAKLTEANKLLEDKNHRLDEFSATLAHDIRGPIGSINMRMEYVLELYGDTIDQRFREILERTGQSTERLLNMVQTMYEFAKLGRNLKGMTELGLEALVKGVLSDLESPINLNVQIGVGDLPDVWGNEGLLRRVFLNLVQNAIKFNDKESILINIGVRKIEKRTLADFVQVYVEDNGPGINEAEAKDIFEMFNRGARQDNNGTGIGLAVVKRIVELHFGEISIDTGSLGGVSFNLLLPMEAIELSG